MNINQDFVLRDNKILVVIYCRSKYHLNWRLNPVLLEKTTTRKRIFYSREDGIETSAPLDHRLSMITQQAS